MERIVGGVSIYEEGTEVKIASDYSDVIGHGTAVIDLLLSQCKDEVKIFVVRILNLNKKCSPLVLQKAFSYIYENHRCNLIHISAGVEGVYKNYELRNIIEKLYEEKVYVVAAYANNGSVSYPAAFQNVIGVDISDRPIKKDQFEYVKGSIINFRTSSFFYRVNWNGNNMILNGSSFSSTIITANVADIISENNSVDFVTILSKMEQKACYVYQCEYFPKLTSAKELAKNITKAIIFPFNKEMYQIAGNENQIDFEVSGYYTYKYDMNIGKQICQVLKYCSNEKIINNIDSVDWESDFDTVILGHCSQIEGTTHKDIVEYIYRQAFTFGKKIYSLSSPIELIKQKKEYKKMVAFPYVDISDVPQNRFGKMRKTSKPVVMVCGTSSKQGKFHVQIELRKRFLADGYNLFQISTEPTGYLFGMDYVYPMGYESTVYVSGQDAILALNNQYEYVDKKNSDILLVGSQSGTIPYQYDNTSKLTIQQTELLMAINPDAVVLCINYDDDINYVERTMKYIESINVCKVLCFCMLPVKYSQKVRVVQKIELTEEEMCNRKKEIKKLFGLELFILGDKYEMDMLYQKVIDFF